MFWNIFYSECKRNGTSPNAVCKAIGLSNAAATGWKNGTLPKADILVKIADHLNCTVDFLLGRESHIHTQTESEWDIILEQMSDDSLLMFREYAKFLLWRQDQAAEDNL